METVTKKTLSIQAKSPETQPPEALSLRVLFGKDLAIVWLQNLALLAAYTLVSALLPLAIQQAGYTESTNGLILGTTSLGLVVSLLLMGRSIDRGDCRLYIAVGAVLWAVTSLFLAVFLNVWVMVVCRFFQGFAYALFYTASLVYATRSVRNELRGTVVGVIEAVGAISIAVTPFFALPISTTWGFQSAFWLSTCLAVLTALGTIFLSPRPLETKSLAEEPSQSSKRHGHILSAHAILPGAVAVCLFLVAVAYVNLAPLIAQQVGVASISLYLGLRAFGTVPTRLLSGYIADRKGVSWAILPGFLVAVLSMLLLPSLTGSAWAFLIPALFGLGMGSASPALTAWMLQTVPADERAIAVNTFTLMTEGSGFFGSWMVGAILQTGRLDGFYLFAGILAAGLVLYVASIHRK